MIFVGVKNGGYASLKQSVTLFEQSVTLFEQSVTLLEQSVTPV